MLISRRYLHSGVHNTISVAMNILKHVPQKLNIHCKHTSISVFLFDIYLAIQAKILGVLLDASLSF